MADLGINDVNPLLVAADNHNIVQGAGSVFDEVGNFVSKMVPAATVSGLYGVLNTPIELANWLGADVKPFDTEDTLSSIDSDLAQYYREHKDSADLLGFIGSSVVSGLGAMKAIKLAQAGKMGTGMASAFNLVPDAKAKYLAQAISQIGADGTTVFSSIATNKLKALGLGLVDNFITSAVMESTAAAVAAASPVFDGKELSDIAWTVGQGALWGSAIGGVLDGILLNSQYKAGILAQEKLKRPLEAVETPGASTLVTGDKIDIILNSALDIPTDAATSNTLKQTLDATQRRVKTTAIQAANDMADGDSVLGNNFMQLVFDVRDTALASGLTKQEVKAKMGDLLQQAKSMRRLRDVDATDVLDPKRYLYPSEKFNIEAEDTLGTFLDKLFPRVKPAPNAQGFLMSKPINELKIGITAPTLQDEIGFAVGARKGFFASEEDAFRGGADIYINMRLKHVRVNPESAKTLVTPGDTGEVIVNLKTGQVVSQANQVVGDLADTAEDIYLARGNTELVVNHRVKDGAGKLRLSTQTFDQKTPLNWNEASTLEASARFAWAEAHPNILDGVPKVIKADDFPVLEKIASDINNLQRAHESGVKILVDGVEVPIAQATPKLTDLQDLIREQKLLVAEQLRSVDPTISNYLLAQKLNVTQDFLESGNAAGAMKPLKDLFTPSHAVIKYDTGPTEIDGMFFRGLVALKQRQGIAARTQQEAFTFAAGNRAAAFPDLTAEIARAEASQTGAGPGFFTSSSPNYGDTLRQAFQASGREAKLWKEAEYELSGQAFADVSAKIYSNPQAATEISVLTEAMRRTGTHYKLTPQGELVASGLADLEKALGQAVDAQDLKAVAALRDKITALETQLKELNVTPKYLPKFQETVEFFTRHVERNAYRVEKQNVLRAANGAQKMFDPDVVYPPPIDTAKFNFHALVREKGVAVDGTNQVGMITAKTQEELQKLASKVDASRYEVLFKKADVEAYHKALGDYQYELSLNQNRVNSYLEREGVLSNFFPKTEPNAVLKEFYDWHYAQDARLVTNSIETKYAQEFAEIRNLGKQYTALGTSRFAGLGELSAKKVENPFEDYIRLATDVSKKANYTLWMDANEFVESLGNKAYTAMRNIFTRAKEGKVSWDQANSLMAEHGLISPFKKVFEMTDFNTMTDRAVTAEFVAKANAVLSNATLRLDFMNSINNVIATPINMGGEMASIRKLVAQNSELAGALKYLKEVQVPGLPGVGVPSTSKLTANAIKRYFGPEGKDLIKYYSDHGVVITTLKMHQDVLDTLALRGGEPASKLAELGSKAVEIGAKISGNELAEQFTRFVSADVMKQLTDPIVAAGKLTPAMQTAYISSFVNRVQGNYIASQRPVLFQGVIGQAIGLFQTYQFNLLQNLFRYVAQGDRKSVAILMGLQTSIYGLNGTPFFDAANRALIGNNSMNPYHKDAYSSVPEIVGKELGEWILYGTASAFPFLPDDSPAIYSRGDINPRHWSIVPLSPKDIPAVSAGVKVVSNVIDMVKKVGGGADKQAAFLEGLEHNGISRPLAGLAQVMQGYATTSKGSLISAAQDFSGIAEFARIAGAKPANEAIALDGAYRITAYQAKDRDRLEILGEEVKTKLRNGGSPTEEEMQDFMSRYTSSGGDIKHFNAAIMRWYKGANQSQINALRGKMGTEYSKRMMEIMGGDASAPLPDYFNTTPGAPANTETSLDSTPQ